MLIVMKCNLRVLGRYSITINKEKIKVNGKTISINDIPCVRYKLDTYDEQSILYIKKMMNQFIRSMHLVEINIKEGWFEETQLIRRELPQVPIMTYLDVDNNDLNTGIRNKTEMLRCDNTAFDRIIIKDNTDFMDMLAASRIKADITNIMRVYGVAEPDIGICGPLGIGDNACLNALKLRELATKYTDGNVALPSAVHQNGCCGCVQYENVMSDCIETVGKVKQVVNKSAKVSKAKKHKGIPAW